MGVYDTSCQAVTGRPKCRMKPLQSLLSLVFVPSKLTWLRCSNTLTYRFSSKRETAHTLDHHSYRCNFAVAKRKPEKIPACTGFKPLTSAILVQHSINWANKPTGSRLQMSRVQIPYKPEFFFRLSFHNCKVASITSMIFFHIISNFLYH